MKEEQWKRELTRSNFELNEERLKVDHMQAQAEDLYRDKIEWVDNLHQLKEETQELLKDRNIWKNRFDALASLANSAVDLVLEQLIGAKVWVSIATVPVEVRDFVECCDDQVKKLRKRIRNEM